MPNNNDPSWPIQDSEERIPVWVAANPVAYALMMIEKAHRRREKKKPQSTLSDKSAKFIEWAMTEQLWNKDRNRRLLKESIARGDNVIPWTVPRDMRYLLDGNNDPSKAPSPQDPSTVYPPVQYTGQPPFTSSAQAAFALGQPGVTRSMASPQGPSQGQPQGQPQAQQQPPQPMPQQRPAAWGPYEAPPPGQPMSPRQANFMLSSFAGPGVARQPSQSAAVNTPGRPAIEGPAPSQANFAKKPWVNPLSLEPIPEEWVNPLSLEPIPESNPLVMEQQPEPQTQMRGAPFELADLMSFAKEQPVDPQMIEAEQNGGMGTSAKIALALGGLGLVLGLRNQYKKDKGTLGRNTANMLNLMGEAAHGYTNYAQTEKAYKVREQERQDTLKKFYDDMMLQAALAQAKQQAEEQADEIKATADAKALADTIDAQNNRFAYAESGRNARSAASLAVERDKIGSINSVLGMATASERTLGAKNLLMEAIADYDAGKLTTPLHPLLVAYNETPATIAIKSKILKDKAKLGDQAEYDRALRSMIPGKIGQSIYETEPNYNAGPFSESMARWILAKAPTGAPEPQEEP